MLKVGFLEYHLNIKMLLCMALIWSAKKNERPCWRVFVLLEICAFKYTYYIFITG